MNVDDYRKAYTAEIEKEKQSAPSGLAPMSASGGRATVDGPDAISKEIATFRDASQPTERRLAALQDIQTAIFSVSGFDRFRASFKDALRAVATEDKDQELRSSALEMLAAKKDEVAQQLLLKGLENPAEAIVSVAKAVQLLAHDDHGVAFPIARKILSGDYDVDAKEEALRVLASDPGSGGLFANILSDRSQPQQLRSMSASGLRAVDPQQFEQLAQRIIVDDHEDDDVRANALGALNHLQGFSTKLNSNFVDALSKIDLAGKSDDLRTAAEKFLQARTSK
jgi:HEAT repeat protein